MLWLAGLSHKYPFRPEPFLVCMKWPWNPALNIFLFVEWLRSCTLTKRMSFFAFLADKTSVFKCLLGNHSISANTNLMARKEKEKENQMSPHLKFCEFNPLFNSKTFAWHIITTKNFLLLSPSPSTSLPATLPPLSLFEFVASLQRALPTLLIQCVLRWTLANSYV